MRRHARQYCKIANGEGGTEKCVERTLQRLEAQNDAQAEKVDSLQAQVSELVSLLKSQLNLSPTDASSEAEPDILKNAQVRFGNGPATNAAANQESANIRPWNGPDRTIISAAALRDVFTENPRLAEYCRLSDEEKVDAERAVPYVLEALVDLVKRAHADPAERNVYLNPRRADQAMVFDEAVWKIVALTEAVRRLFDNVAGSIHRIIITDAERNQLPFGVQASASWIPNLYYDDPDKYVARAKPLMSAHLANMAPPAGR